MGRNGRGDERCRGRTVQEANSPEANGETHREISLNANRKERDGCKDHERSEGNGQGRMVLGKRYRANSLGGEQTYTELVQEADNPVGERYGVRTVRGVGVGANGP